MKLNKIKVAVLIATNLIIGVSALAGTVALTGTTENTCSSYSNFSVDANGNLTIICGENGNPTPNPTPTPTPTVTRSDRAPTATSPIAEIKAWNFAFETLNYIPHNVKWEPVNYMNYLKLIQSNKPTIILLPTSW